MIYQLDFGKFFQDIFKREQMFSCFYNLIKTVNKKHTDSDMYKLK
jgi:hypothetical protein